MASFVIDLDDPKERWDELYAEIAARALRPAHEPDPPAAAPAAADDSPLAWVLSIGHWNGS
jgi:hypothetical protein